MGSASLKGGKLYGTGLAAALCCQEIRQIGGSSLQLLVSKCVHIISYASKLADIASVSQLDSFGYSNDNGGFLFQKVFHFCEEFLNIKGNLRKVNEIWSFAVF